MPIPLTAIEGESARREVDTSNAARQFIGKERETDVTLYDFATRTYCQYIETFAKRSLRGNRKSRFGEEFSIRIFYGSSMGLLSRSLSTHLIPHFNIPQRPNFHEKETQP